MDASKKHIRRQRAFTLVELLVVVAIIGILAGLITAAAIAARRAATEAVIQTEIGQLDAAMTNYNSEYGEFPPDFFLAESDAVSQQEVARHIIRVFPRYDYSSEGDIWKQFKADLFDNYGIDLSEKHLDPASALVFWLCGLPETENGERPAGFHSDPRHPFKPGKPRTRTFYEFNTEDGRLEFEDSDGGLFRYYAKNLKDAPFVYFKARQITETGRWEYGWVDGSFIPAYYCHLNDETNKAVPYLDGEQADTDGGDIYGREKESEPESGGGDPILRPWRNPKKFQIQHAGLDARYGDGNTEVTDSSFRYTKTGDNFSKDQRDHTNLLNGARGSLGDELE